MIFTKPYRGIIFIIGICFFLLLSCGRMYTKKQNSLPIKMLEDKQEGKSTMTKQSTTTPFVLEEPLMISEPGEVLESSMLEDLNYKKNKIKEVDIRKQQVAKPKPIPAEPEK